MHRASSIFGSAIFLVAAPGTVAVYAPWAISHWHLTPPLLGWFPLRVIGVFMIAAGTPVLLDSLSALRFRDWGHRHQLLRPSVWSSLACIVGYATRCMLPCCSWSSARDCCLAASVCWSTGSSSGWDFLLLSFSMKSLNCTGSLGRIRGVLC